MNHQLRGEDAEADSNFVENLGRQLEIKTFIFSRNVSEYSKDHKMSFEEAARELRYECFRKVMEETQCNRLAIGQNKNDQVETFFLRAFRGAGLEGLTAIKHKRQNVIRPLLGISRDEIMAYIDRYHLDYRIDKSNYEVLYARNKIRNEMIPYIKEHFNENIIDQIYRSVQLLQEDLDFIDLSVEQVYQSLNLQKPRYEMDLNRLRDLHESLKSRLIRKMIEDFLGNLKEVSYGHIQDLDQLISKGDHGKKIFIQDKVCFEISYEKLLVYQVSYAKALKASNFDVNQSFKWHNQRVTKVKNYDNNKTNDFITIDADKIKGQLNLRTRKPGDRFIPLGMSGHKKLKDFMIDLKIPLYKRDEILLLCDDDVIIWVVGYRMSEAYKVTNKTQNKISFKLEWL